jgi:glycosyltransferase involved in cell wall biosynthesis
MSATPLVSILIPAYNERHFGEAFASALAQDGVPLEVVVCDDSPGTAIEAAVRGARDSRVRYERNAPRRGFGANFSHCLELARGELVKFLNDDDRLRPGCVATLAGALNANAGVKLATSRRLAIDEGGRRIADVAGTMPLSHVSAVMSGRELGDFVLAHSLNMIGEPTTVMFRRRDLVPEDGMMFRWGGRDYHCLADMSVWLRLLAQGLAYYAAPALSEFRIHAGQEQQGGVLRVGCLVERFWIVSQARAAGFLASRDTHRMALASVRARVEAGLRAADLTDAEGAQLRELATQVEGEEHSLR